MNLQELQKKMLEIKITKSWIYLVYLYLLLPGVLFLLGWLLRDTALGVTFGILFHNYGLFCINVIPKLSAFTGLVGLVIAGYLLLLPLLRRDWLDLGISAGLVALNAAYFLLGGNYLLLRFLRLQ